MKIILGSQSGNRKQVLTDAGYTFDIMVSGIDEKAIRHENWYDMPILIAKAKAEALLARIKEPALLITADVVVVWNGELREKPIDGNEARVFLKSFSESPHPVECVNGIVVTNTETGAVSTGTDISKIFFGKIPDELIETLIEEGGVTNWAGAFTLLDPRIKGCVSRIEGVFDSVLGLPMDVVEKCMRELS